MSGVKFPSKILAFIISTAIIAKAHGMHAHPYCRALYQSLKTTQAMWRGPCNTYSKTMDCSLLFGNYLMPNLNPRINAGFINPLPHQLANIFENPELCGVNVLRPSIVMYTTHSTLRRVNNFDHLSENTLLSRMDNLPSEDTMERFAITTNSNEEVTEPDNYINITPINSDDAADDYEVPTIEPFKPTITPEYAHNVPSTFQSSRASEEPVQNELEVSHLPTPGLVRNKETLFKIFKETLDRLERKFFLTTFQKLTAISPENRKENGISFLQSGLLLHLLLVTLSTEMDQNVTREIEDSLGLKASRQEKIDMVKLIVSWLPKSSEDLKFRWSSRLVLGRAASASRQFQHGTAAAVNLTLSWLNGTETPRQITQFLNELVEDDSGGAIHDTFEEEEVSGGVCGAGVAVLYLRGRWRAAPTLLNGSQPFHDAAAAPPRATALFRINDVMAYAYLHEWNAEAIEIPYATPGLTLLMVVPKEPSLARLVRLVARAGLAFLADMRPLRLSVTLPLYTLRMTLLLPNKLQHMGMPSLVMANNTKCESLKLSHAVQRLMFWAEAGRSAYKDDGIEWDPRPEMELVLDRPYLFFVRWNNITLMNGNFVL